MNQCVINYTLCQKVKLKILSFFDRKDFIFRLSVLCMCCHVLYMFVWTQDGWVSQNICTLKRFYFLFVLVETLNYFAP